MTMRLSLLLAGALACASSLAFAAGTGIAANVTFQPPTTNVFCAVCRSNVSDAPDVVPDGPDIVLHPFEGA